MTRSRSLSPRGGLLLLLACAVWLPTAAYCSAQQRDAETTADSALSLRGLLLSTDQCTDASLAEARAEGFTAVALVLEGGDDAVREAVAARRVLATGLDLYYWVEVARNASLADQHPRWMASLQGHTEWRRHFPHAPHPGEHEVVKTYPWVPIFSAEAFAAQRDRVVQLVRDKPAAKGVFLNDLQAGPSACGCGNTLCRWTADYGPKRTATPLGDDAAARFVRELQQHLPGSPLIPVWTTECEEEDSAADGPCAGVPCFRGKCWQAYTRQLTPLASEVDTLGVLLAWREFGRAPPDTDAQDTWLSLALRSFETMLPRAQAPPIESGRLIAVLQGWDVPSDELAAAIRLAEASQVRGYLVARHRIEQGWQPRIIPVREP